MTSKCSSYAELGLGGEESQSTGDFPKGSNYSIFKLSGSMVDIGFWGPPKECEAPAVTSTSIAGLGTSCERSWTLRTPAFQGSGLYHLALCWQ